MKMSIPEAPVDPLMKMLVERGWTFDRIFVVLWRARLVTPCAFSGAAIDIPRACADGLAELLSTLEQGPRER